MTDQRPATADRPQRRPSIVGDVVFGGAASPVAVCTLGSRALLPALAGRPEIAVAGRVFTENVGVERMVQNLAAFEKVRYLIVCGHETRHRVGQTILALHRDGLDADGRVIGSEAPDPVMPNLTADQLRAFQTRISVIDMIGVIEAAKIVVRAGVLAAEPAPTSEPRPQTPVSANDVKVVVASRDPATAWEYDPVGYFLVFVDRARRLLRVERRTPEHLLQTVFEGRRAEELCHTIVRRGEVSLLAHAAYLGRELAKAEAALDLDLAYDQDRPLVRPSAPSDPEPGEDKEVRRGDGSGDSRAP